VSRRARIGLLAACAGSAAGFAWLGLARFATFHNETFDLAFYTRMAWGLAQGDYWEPIVGAHVFGLHLSPIVVPLGWIGLAVGSVPVVLLVAQGVALGATAWPLARIGQRRLGDWGVLAGAAAWLLYPNVSHVAGFEFHPGTLAVLPLAWAMDGVDRGSWRGLVLGVLGVLCCREDLALVTVLLGLVAWRSRPELRVAGIATAVASAAWVLLFALVLHPAHAPEEGSMQLHFGRWGDGPVEALGAMLSQPGTLLAHLSAPERLRYLPKILFPLALLPLLSPRWLLVAAPVLAINLLSDFPTTTDMDEHYLTPAVPVLVVGALDGVERVVRGLSPPLAAAGLTAAVLASHLLAGGTPASAAFDPSSFTREPASAHAEAAVAHVPDDPDTTVQAPYALMPHLAERWRLGPAPPPDRDTDWVILDAWHRFEYAGNEDLLRTAEEPGFRSWLGRDDYGVVAVEGRYAVLLRGADPRGPVLDRYLVGRADPSRGRRIAACLALLDARVVGDRLELDLVARDACPKDLALRIGTGRRPRRVDLPFDGWLSPAHLGRGDLLRSVHRLSEAEQRRIRARGLRVGALRSSGARPEHGDPVAIDVELSGTPASSLDPE